MYKILGTRLNGHKIDKEYEDKEMAEFEFEIMLCIAQKVSLLEDGNILNNYSLAVPVLVTYVIQGESPFNRIHKVIKNDRAHAEFEFNSESQRCDWVTLYEHKDGEQNQLDIYIRKVA